MLSIQQAQLDLSIADYASDLVQSNQVLDQPIVMKDDSAAVGHKQPARKIPDSRRSGGNSQTPVNEIK